MRLPALKLMVSVAVIALPGVGTAQTVVHRYDTLGRLTQTVRGSQATGAVATYSYDPAGNRTVVTVTPPSAGCTFNVQDASGNDEFTFNVPVLRTGNCAGPVIINYIFSSVYPAGSVRFETADAVKAIKVTSPSCGPNNNVYTVTITVGSGQATIGRAVATVTVYGNC